MGKRGIQPLTAISLPITHVYCIQTPKHIVKLFSRSDSSTILVFMSLSAVIHSKRTPQRRGGALSTRGLRKKLAIFSHYLAICWKLYKISPCFLRNVNRKSQLTDRSLSVSTCALWVHVKDRSFGFTKKTDKETQVVVIREKKKSELITHVKMR